MRTCRYCDDATERADYHLHIHNTSTENDLDVDVCGYHATRMVTQGLEYIAYGETKTITITASKQ